MFNYQVPYPLICLTGPRRKPVPQIAQSVPNVYKIAKPRNMVETYRHSSSIRVVLPLTF